MEPATQPAIRGTWGTLLLPIEPDESICWSRLGEEIDRLIAAGVDGIYSNGTAGEFHTQSEAEFDRIHDLLAGKCGAAGMAWQAGAAHMSAQISLDRVRRAASLGPSAIQVILPDWCPVSNEEALRFLARIAGAAAPAPLVLYNPPHAKRSLSPADFGMLAQDVPALAGVKVGHSGAEWCSEFRRLAPGLSLFVPGHELASGMAHGAHGAYSNVACLSPAGAVRWNRQMTSDPASALDLETRIRQFLSDSVLPFRHERGISNPGLDKLLAAIGGWADVGTRLRWPYSWIPEAEAIRLRSVARGRMPELFGGDLP
ncbi:MAG: dihydrodipicolinate synthase family protein [Acidobacteriota bacterium]|nr:dihydrodipicolinate synthase family protein [Acidobacteriota bacterium]